MYYILIYEYVADVLERRPAHRNEHLGLLRELNERGVVPIAGAYDDPVDGASIVFRTDDTSVIDDFVAKDPYIKNGLVASWRIRKWNVVIGGDSAS